MKFFKDKSKPQQAHIVPEPVKFVPEEYPILPISPQQFEYSLVELKLHEQSTNDEFVASCNARMQEGWRPIGSTSVSQRGMYNLYVQAFERVIK